MLPCVTINSLILHGGYLFVAGEKGIYRSTDIKGNWTACNTGLPKNTYGLTEDIGSLVSNGTKLFAGGLGLICLRRIMVTVGGYATHWVAVPAGLWCTAPIYMPPGKTGSIIHPTTGING